MPKLTIDGKEVEVPQGTRVIEAAKRADTDIPFYCYHPGLSIAGNCRMCLVEIEKMPKLQIACHMQARDGMVVHTKNERVLKTRQHILEFLLVNHPVDCPVCDQAGECWLQDYYLRHGAYDSRVNENKVKKPKAQSIGPTVMLDAERCILCSRCVRFTDEVSKTQELGIINRGDHSEITIFPGKELNNPYSGNVVDICPVGALTDKDFRFKMRVWYLKSEPTLCNGCSRGCNISMQYREGGRPHHAKGERVIRIKPRYHDKINKWWMCDEGRYGYKDHDHNRILNPVRRKGGKIEESDWKTLLPEIARLLDGAQKKAAVALSPQMSNEELFLARKFFQEKLKFEKIFFASPKPQGFEDDILIRADKNPNTQGGKLLGLARNADDLKTYIESAASKGLEGLILFGQDLLFLYGNSLNEALESLKWIVYIGSNHNLTSGFSTYLLPSATYAEKNGTFTNFQGMVQQFHQVMPPLGDALSEWQILVELAKAMGMHLHYDEAEEIFEEAAKAVSEWKDLSYEKLQIEDSKMREFAAPMIPQLTQSSDLIFMQQPLESQKELKSAEASPRP